MRNFKIIMFAISMMAIVGWAGAAFAADPPTTFGATASVTVIAPITISQTTGMTFGNVVAPASGTHTALSSAVGATNGVFAIVGGAAFTSGASVEVGDTCDAGLTLSVSDDNGGATLTVTGTLTVGVAAVAGLRSCMYTVSANYS